MSWGTRRNDHLQKMLDHATVHAQEGHATILKRLEENKGILLEHLQRVDTKVDKIDTTIVVLETRVQALATWRENEMTVIMTLGKIVVILWPMMLAAVAGLWFLFNHLGKLPKP